MGRILCLSVVVCVATPVFAQVGSSQKGGAWKKAYLISRAGHAWAQEEFEAAKQLFESVLAVDPDDVTALRHLALLERQAGRRNRALVMLERAAKSHPDSYSAQAELGGLLLEMGRPDEARTYLSAATRLQPDVVDAWVNLGDAFALGKAYSKAKRSYVKALAIDPKSAWAKRQLAFAHFNLGESEEALRLLSLAIKAFPKNASLHHVLGHVYRGLGQPRKALREYSNAVDLSPNVATYHLFVGICAQDLNRTQEALSALRTAQRLAPKSPEIGTHLAGFYKRQGDFAEARRGYERVLKQSPKYVWALVEFGMLEAEDGRLLAAGQLLERALSLSPRNADVGLTIGDIYRRRGDLSEAITHYERVLTYAPDSWKAHHKLAGVFLARGMISDASGHARSAVKLAPRRAQTHIQLADCLRREGAREKARVQYERAIKLADNPDWAMRQLGTLTFELGEPVRAAALLEQILPRFQSDTEVLLTLGHIARGQNHAEQALTYYEKAMASADGDARPSLFVAELRREQGNYEAAIDLFRNAVRIDPNYLDAWVLLGDVLRIYSREQDLGNNQRALEREARLAYEQAAEIDPEATWPIRQLGFLAFQDGDSETAEQMLRQAALGYPDDHEITLVRGHVARATDERRRALDFYLLARSQAPPDDERPAMFVGLVYRELGEFERSLSFLDEAVQANPTAGWAWHERALTLADARNFPGALESAEKAIDLLPDGREPWLLAGRMRHLARFFSQAVKAYRRAIEIDYAYGPSHLALGSALLDRGEEGALDEAAAEVAIALQTMDENAFAHLVAGQIETRRFLITRRDRPVDAESLRSKAAYHLERALVLTSSDRPLRLAIARNFYELERDQDTLRTLDPLLKIDRSLCLVSALDVSFSLFERAEPVSLPSPRTVEEIRVLETTEVLAFARVLQGDVLLRQKKLEGSRDAYACAIVLQPSVSEAHLRLALIYERMDVRRLAEQHYRIALMLDPENKSARAGLARLDQDDGYPITPQTTIRSGLVFESLEVPVEVLSARGEVLSALSLDADSVLKVPRRISLSAGAGIAPLGGTWLPEVDFDAGFESVSGTFLNDARTFESLDGARFDLRFRQSQFVRRFRKLELGYVQRNVFSFGRSPSLRQRSLVHRFGGHASWVGLGRIDTFFDVEHIWFRRQDRSDGDRLLRGFSGEILIAPYLGTSKFNLSGGLRMQRQALIPSRRKIWAHQVFAEGSLRFGRYYLHLEDRIGLARDSIAAGDGANRPLRVGHQVEGTFGRRWGARASAGGRLRFDHVLFGRQRFGGTVIGAVGDYDLAHGLLGSAKISCRASYDVRLAWGGRVSHFGSVSVQLSH